MVEYSFQDGSRQWIQMTVLVLAFRMVFSSVADWTNCSALSVGTVLTSAVLSFTSITGEGTTNFLFFWGKELGEGIGKIEGVYMAW